MTGEVKYKFQSALDFSTVNFEGEAIALDSLRKKIIEHVGLTNVYPSNFDLEFTNVLTKEVYKQDKVMIPSNTSVLIKMEKYPARRMNYACGKKGIMCYSCNDPLRKNWKTSLSQSQDSVDRGINPEGGEDSQDGERYHCRVCHELFTKPMISPCCKTSFCYECIRKILKKVSECPSCKVKKMNFDDFVPNDTLAAEVQEYKCKYEEFHPHPLPPM